MKPPVCGGQGPFKTIDPLMMMVVVVMMMMMMMEVGLIGVFPSL
jgi:hypothetical protein